MVGDETRLDGDYAAFGKVIEGMEIIDSIMTDVKTDDPNGMLSKAKQPVIERIEMITE
jgi:peptidyl-prolyl cis-trans isomerase B (cyclophilin B)